MEKKKLQIRMTIRALMIGLLIGVTGIMDGFAQYFTVDNLRYWVSGPSTVTLAGSTSGLSGTLTIPSSVTYNDVAYTVTKIADNAFWGCSNLSGDLVIPNTVKEIGSNAFSGCTGLCCNLTISNTIQKIGSSAFYNCWFSNISSLPNTLVSIGSGAFYGTEWYWNQPEGIIYLNNWCLGYKGSKPTGDLIIRQNTKGIAGNSFFYCNGLLSVTLPSTVMYVGDEAFEMCDNLTSVNIPNSVITIGDGAFAGTKLPSIVLGNSVTYIGNSAFSGCPLVSVNIPNTVTTIGESAFSGCPFTTIDIPNSVISIGNCAFCGSGLESVSIPNSITTIQEGVFSGCSALSTIEIPNSVTTIGSNAFWGCESLTNIDFPNSVTSIEMMAFGSCTGFTSFTIPNSVVFLGDGVFRDCTNLVSVYVGNSVASIEGRLFDGCTNLVQIVVDSENNTYDSRNNCNAIIKTSNNRLDVGCKTTIIPNSVTSIGFSAFLGCYGLTSIEIPDSVIEICGLAFTYCSGLTSIEIPNSVTEIGEAAFAGSGLTSIIIPNSVTSIGTCAFQSCANLLYATIGNSATFIGNQIFDDCRGMEYVNMLSETPPTFGYYGYDIDFPTLNTDFTIYVPYESLEAYKTAMNWSTYESYIQPLVYTNISGYDESADNWRFIASPLAVTTDPTTVENMITETAYDLYQFSQSATDGEWQNYKANNFNLLNGRGYLYANEEDAIIIFKGAFNEFDTKEVGIQYHENATFAGWNLIGNPFPVSAYANRSYYVMNEEGTAIEPVAVSMETTIPACTGVMVKADNAGETVTFSKTASRGQENQGVLQIALKQVVNRVGPSTGSGALIDKAIVSFNSGDKLEKFVFNKDNAQLYIPSGKNNYAIICVEKTGEMPLNFEAKKNGTYTITVDAELPDVEYLHLIDNITGDDVDLLIHPAYTFEAKTTEYASRFRLVFNANETGGPSTSSGTFAFINNCGNLNIYGIEGKATLQVVDMLGHVLSSEAFSGSYEKKLNVAPGVYMLRLNNGNDVKVQKIVVK